ncbi:signal peptidase I [bacterium]|nr:MAG: signal peptidase I [bacterium]
MAKQKHKPKEEKPYRPSGFETLIIALAIALILRATVIQAFNIPSGSMEDTLLVGDFLLGEKITFRFRNPRPGEIVIFEHPRVKGRELIKRCVAVAGDTVEVVNKVLYVNGKKFPDPPKSKHIDPNIYPRQYTPRDNFGPFVVPPNCIFMMGDNRDNSEDSRFWGALPLKNVKARPLFLYFSISPGPHPVQVRRNIDIYISLLKSLFHFPPLVRPMRIGMIIK